MPSLNETFTNHPVCKLYKSMRKDIVLEHFSSWINETTYNDWHLSLYKFAEIRPLTYFDPKIIETLLDFFEANHEVVFDALYALQGEITHAFASILRQGNSWDNENSLSVDNPKGIKDFESVWHPEYQRYCEHIFNHLIRIPLYILGNLHNKNYLSPPLANRVQILANNNLSLLVKGCNSIVRNAISHGSIVFQYQDIKYIDHDKSITMASYDFSKLFDDLVDNCHSFVIAILLFLSNNSLKAIQKGLNKLPLGIRQLFIDSFTSHGELEIASMVESETIDGRKQLNIFCNSKTPSRLNHIFDGLNIAYHIMKFGDEDYNRLAIMLDSNKPVVSSLFINANRLKDAIKNNENIDSCSKEILETSLLWYDSSRLRRKINAWKNIAIPIWRMYKKNLIKEREKRGLKVLSSRYLIRLIENKSTEKISRIEAHVVLKGKIEINILQKEPIEIRSELIENILNHIVKHLRNSKYCLTDLQGEKRTKRKPNYIWIRMYTKDARIRTLKSSGWKEKNLIIRAEWFSRWKNMKPILIRNPHAIFKRILIEYNPELPKGTY